MIGLIIRLAIWCTGFAFAVILAWCALHLQPIPRLTLDSQSERQLMSFSHDGKHLATSSAIDDSVHIWDAATGRQLFEANNVLLEMEGDRYGIYGESWKLIRLCVDRGNKFHPGLSVSTLAFLLSLGDDTSHLLRFDLGILDSESGVVQTLLRTTDFNRVFSAPIGKRFASYSGRSKKIERHVWDCSQGIRDIPVPDSRSPQAFSADGKTLICYSDNPRGICLWKLDSDEVKNVSQSEWYALSHNHRWVAFGEMNNSEHVISIWDANNDDMKWRLPTAEIWVSRGYSAEERKAKINDAVAVSDDGESVVVLDETSEAFGWIASVRDKTKKSQLRRPPNIPWLDRAYTVDFSSNNQTIITKHLSSAIAIWEHTPNGAELRAVFCSAGAFDAKGNHAIVFGELVTQPMDFGAPEFSTSSTVQTKKYGVMSTGCGVAGLWPNASFHCSCDGRWLSLESRYSCVQSQLANWFNRNMPATKKLFPSNTKEVALIDCANLRTVGHWVGEDHGAIMSIDRQSAISPDALAFAIKLPDGQIALYDLPPRRHLLLPIAMHLPLLILIGLFARMVWQWRKRSSSSVAVSTARPVSPSPSATGLNATV